MDGRIRLDGFVEVLCFALLVEEAVLVALRDEEVELEIAPRELHAAGDGCPLTESDRTVIERAISQRIATDNILLQHKSERLAVT